MEEQLDFARILYDSSYGIALRKPAQEIDVGDICYWTPDGRASRILNVFDNKQVPHPRTTSEPWNLLIMRLIFVVACAE